MSASSDDLQRVADACQELAAAIDDVQFAMTSESSRMAPPRPFREGDLTREQVDDLVGNGIARTKRKSYASMLPL